MRTKEDGGGREGGNGGESYERRREGEEMKARERK